MDVSLENLTNVIEPKWAHFGRKKTLKTSEKVMELMNSEKFRQASSGNAPMTAP
jgi:small subunit ribosomal protein S10